VGFRAPNFSIDKRCPWALEVLADAGFWYDSSVVSGVARASSTPYDLVQTRAGDVYEFPIYNHVAGRSFGIRVIGGTYFRLLPVRLILHLMRLGASLGYTPSVYLHASDLVTSGGTVSWTEMNSLPVPARLGWLVRQRQWTLGARGAAEKLKAVLEAFPNLGPMRSALPR
jgi:hypothetical protein